MKILNITAQKPHSTGSGTYLTELVRAFDRMGHKQAVVAGIYKDDSVCFPSGVDFYPVCFKSSTLPFNIVGMSDIMPYESTLYRDLNDEMLAQFEDAFISVITEAVSRLDPDIIFCHHLFLLTALVRKHFPDRLVYGISHGTDLRQIINCPKLADTIRPEIRKLDIIFSLHNAQLTKISELFNIDTDDRRLKVIGSGYNPDIFNCDSRSPLVERMPRIIYAGKISRPKGVAELLCALEILDKDPEVATFETILAGGCQDASMLPLIEACADYVNYVGPLPQHELSKLFKTGDIFVLPSYFEGLPLVVIEAMASGLLPVCTDLPGIREWLSDNIPDNNVIFIPMPEMRTVDSPVERDIPEFIQNIYRALKLSLRMISEGIDKPDTSVASWDAVASKILSV